MPAGCTLVSMVLGTQVPCDDHAARPWQEAGDLLHLPPYASVALHKAELCNKGDRFPILKPAPPFRHLNGDNHMVV